MLIANAPDVYHPGFKTTQAPKTQEGKTNFLPLPKLPTLLPSFTMVRNM